MVNKFFVGVLGNDIVIGSLGLKFSKQDALELAAWLVALSFDKEKFESILKEIESC